VSSTRVVTTGIREVTPRVNGLGEGAVWVCDENGLSKRAICFVVRVHLATHNEDAEADIVRSYTVAKATMSCNFSPPTYQSEHLHTMSHEWIVIRTRQRKASKSDSSRRYWCLHRMHLYVFISVEIHTSLREVQLPVLTGTRLRAYEAYRGLRAVKST
jgi:hypothetical protein